MSLCEKIFTCRKYPDDADMILKAYSLKEDYDKSIKKFTSLFSKYPRNVHTKVKDFVDTYNKLCEYEPAYCNYYTTSIGHTKKRQKALENICKSKLNSTKSAADKLCELENYFKQVGFSGSGLLNALKKSKECKKELKKLRSDLEKVSRNPKKDFRSLFKVDE